MNWLTSIVLAVLLLSLQYDETLSLAPTLSRSPWTNPVQASSLMNCLITKIAGSDVLPQQEKEDLESIMDTLMSAIRGASAKGKSSGAQLQAINMAVASSLAEIVVAEDAGNQASIAVKTQALSGALEQCYQAVVGRVDRKFLSEINNLISMFAKEAAAENNEIPEQGAFYAEGTSATSSFQASDSRSGRSSLSTSSASNSFSQTGNAASSSSASNSFSQTGNAASTSSSTTGYSASQMTGQSSLDVGQQTSGVGAFAVGTGFVQPFAANTGLISRLARALENSNTLRSVLGRNTSRQSASTLLQRAVQGLGNILEMDVNNVSRVALQELSLLPPGSDTSAYSQALASGLFKAGVLNENNFESLASQVLSGLYNGFSNAAQSMGMNIDSRSVQSDIRSGSSSLSTSSASNSFSQTGNAASSSSASNSFSQTGNAASTSSSTTGYSASQMTGQSSLDVGQQTSGVGSFAVGTGFVQPFAANTGLISRLARALENSNTLRSVLGRNTSQQSASTLLQRAVQTLSNTLDLDVNNVSRAALQELSLLPPGSDTSAYSQALASGLFKAGVLNENNFESLASQVLSGLYNGFSNAAQSMGMNIDSRSVQSDIRSGSSSLSTSSASNSFSQNMDTTTVNSLTDQFTSGGAQFQSASDRTSSFASSALSQAGFSGSTGFIPSDIEKSTGISVSSTLNSPIGLRSGAAVPRIRRLTSSISNAISPYGVDSNALASTLQENLSALQSSGMSSSDAKTEVLFETVAGLLQLLSNTQIRGVNFSTSPSVANSVAKSFEYVLA